MRILLILLLLLAAPAARAQSPLAPLASNSFDDIAHGVEALAASGDPRAAPVLDALQTGRLFVGPGNALFIKDAAGAVTEAQSGSPAPDAAPSAAGPRQQRRPPRGRRRDGRAAAVLARRGHPRRRRAKPCSSRARPR